MAFSMNGLKRFDTLGSVGNGDGSIVSFYGYVTNDDAAAVETSGYFNGAATLFRKGDIIDAVLALGSTPPVRKGYIVTARTATTVTIGQQTVFVPG